MLKKGLMIDLDCFKEEFLENVIVERELYFLVPRSCLDDEVEDDEGRGEGTEGNPTVFGGAAKEPGLTSLPAAWC